MRTCHAEPPPTTNLKAERRTRWVVVLTFVTMVGELVVGTLAKSLALVADGWHMATHAGALGLAAAAYWYARRHERTNTFAFGTGKILSLTAFANAIVLVMVALAMAAEAIARLVHPEKVNFGEALPVAVLGLLVNLGSFFLLHPGEDGGHGHGHAHGHGHGHGHHDHDHAPGAGHDPNLRAAYLHVAADALTSLTAIFALVGGRAFGWVFLDPLMALVGSVVILRWGYGLIRQSAGQLLDLTPRTDDSQSIRAAIEGAGGVVCDLHLWDNGPLHRVCVVSIASPDDRPVGDWRTVVLRAARVDHLTVEVELLPERSRAAF